MENDSISEIINKRIVRAWACAGIYWLVIFPLVGVLVSIKFHQPDFLGDLPWFTFGRLRPVHVNGVIFGAFSTCFIALIYFAVPGLCGRKLYKEEWSIGLLWLWNIFLIGGSVSLLLGYNLGMEAAEFGWPINLLRFLILGAITIQILGTIFKRVEPRFYVSLWYISAAFVWTVFNLILGNLVLPYTEITGVDSAAMHGLYIHYIVGLWLTPAGLGVTYYFLPLSVKQSLFSHKLSLIGFWSLAFFYPFVGTHHYLFSPIPYWTQTISIVTSMMLIIPVWVVVVNFFGTARGRWGQVAGGSDADAYAAKFLILGTVYYLLGCFQGSVEALRRMQELTHFNDFVIAHSHLTVFGAMVLWVVGGLYYIWPRVTGRKLWSSQLASWHLWLTVVGFSIMAVGLTAQGFVQGSMLEYGANFIDSVKEMKPWWVTRTIVGLTMDIAIILMAFNFYKTSRWGDPFSMDDKQLKPVNKVPMAALPRKNFLETPSTVIVAAGIGFFSLAVASQGIIPLVTTKFQNSRINDVVTGASVIVPPYTPEEAKGRGIYIREGCWYCHSQFIRPVTGESLRWGPVSQAGEHIHDLPHLFGTRRIGPDLTRIGRRYGDDWHTAHYWNPREVVPDSIMPRFPWLFDLDKNQQPVPNTEGKALIAYIQRLGTDIGDWREDFVSTRISYSGITQVSRKNQTDLNNLGEQVYQRRCRGCHGDEGNGKGPAARFMDPKPRDFTRGIFKFHSTPGQDALPTDGDLIKTITHGLWGTAMPPWYSISEQERIAVIQYIKTFSDHWQKENVNPPITVPIEPPVSEESISKGANLFEQNCTLCHGSEGRGDGPLAGQMEDAWGFLIRPANFTLPAGVPGGVKLGHDSQHLFTTIMNGVGGTPMPAFSETLDPNQVWDLVHFVQSLRVKEYETRLIERGMNTNDRESARQQIWSMLSQATTKGDPTEVSP